MAIHKSIRIHQYLDDWLVRATSVQTCLQHTQDLVKICQTIRLAGEFRNIRTGTKQVFDLVGYRFDLRAGRVRPTPDRWQNLQDMSNTVTTGLSGTAVHVSDRFTNSHRKASSPRLTSYEIHTVASQKQLEGTRVTRKGDSNTKVPAPTFTMVAARGQESTGQRGSRQCGPTGYTSPGPQTLDRSLKSDRSLFPVRALRYYLDRSSGRRRRWFLSPLRKVSTKDISPASIFSWIKKTVILCYELSDQEAHSLHQVKAHDVRAFAAPKVFQSGVSSDPIFSACH